MRRIKYDIGRVLTLLIGKTWGGDSLSVRGMDRLEDFDAVGHGSNRCFWQG